MLSWRLVFPALLFKALHKGVELRNLLWRQDGAHTGMRFLTDGLVALTVCFVLRRPLRSCLVDNGPKLCLLVRGELKFARKVIYYLGARGGTRTSRVILVTSPDGLSPEMVADSAHQQAENENNKNEYGGFPPRPRSVSAFHFWLPQP